MYCDHCQKYEKESMILFAKKSFFFLKLMLHYCLFAWVACLTHHSWHWLFENVDSFEVVLIEKTFRRHFPSVCILERNNQSILISWHILGLIIKQNVPIDLAWGKAYTGCAIYSQPLYWRMRGKEYDFCFLFLHVSLWVCPHMICLW